MGSGGLLTLPGDFQMMAGVSIEILIDPSNGEMSGAVYTVSPNCPLLLEVVWKVSWLTEELVGMNQLWGKN